MGDGPGYDAMYDRLAKQAQTKHDRQIARQQMLHKMMMTVGMGDCDGNNTLVEKEIVKQLQMAYELLSLNVNANRRNQ